MRSGRRELAEGRTRRWRKGLTAMLEDEVAQRVRLAGLPPTRLGFSPPASVRSAAWPFLNAAIPVGRRI